MIKIDSAKIVCTAAQVQQLLAMGIAAQGVLCYEWQAQDEDGSAPEDYAYLFAGEYIDQNVVIPAWTYEELCVMIGGDYSKPDIFGISDFTPNRNMLQYAFYLQDRCIEFPNGAQAAAYQLQYMLENNNATAAECNKRFTEFYEKQY